MANTTTPVADFTPTKRFFVQMLTRDIDLNDAILDLLDNSLDGVARSQKKNPDEIDYHGYEAEITVTKSYFEIKDNCGGIPTASLDYAFRMGKPEKIDSNETLATVGVYGIGMKRSIFKIGTLCEIATYHENDVPFKVRIDKAWMHDDKQWQIPIQQEMPIGHNVGTTIRINELHPGISKAFDSNNFKTDLINKIIFSYSYILEKGFKVKVNDEYVKANPVTLMYEQHQDKKDAIEPYIYSAVINDVEIDLIVGFHSTLASDLENQEERKHSKYDSKNAGWTIVCNDRIVVYKDKTELTGWGLEIPRYHTQFIAISGIVYFRSKKPENLPITTTKRGVDSTSPVFLSARKHIIEGTKLFIDYTNKWKGEELIKESNVRLMKSESCAPLDLIKLRPLHEQALSLSR
jgi:hypothetical protein